MDVINSLKDQQFITLYRCTEILVGYTPNSHFLPEKKHMKVYVPIRGG
jgi:hypothetical protein